MAVLTYTVLGASVTTATTPGEFKPGMIVLLPDGRAGEVTEAFNYTDGAWFGVRAWDQCASYAYPASELQPWIDPDLEWSPYCPFCQGTGTHRREVCDCQPIARGASPDPNLIRYPDGSYDLPF